MCYEFWHHPQKRAKEEDFAKRMEEMIEKSKPTAPAPKKTERPETAPEKEFVPV